MFCDGILEYRYLHRPFRNFEEGNEESADHSDLTAVATLENQGNLLRFGDKRTPTSQLHRPANSIFFDFFAPFKSCMIPFKYGMCCQSVLPFFHQIVSTLLHVFT